MRVNNVSGWTQSLRNNIRAVANNAGGSGTAAQYYADSSMLYFFNSGRKNPSVAKVIVHDEMKKQGLMSKFRFFKKFNSYKFESERQEFNDTFSKLYPKSGDLRNKIIDSGRLTLDKVKSKASSIEKALMNVKKL